MSVAENELAFLSKLAEHQLLINQLSKDALKLDEEGQALLDKSKNKRTETERQNRDLVDTSVAVGKLGEEISLLNKEKKAAEEAVQLLEQKLADYSVAQEKLDHTVLVVTEQGKKLEELNKINCIQRIVLQNLSLCAKYCCVEILTTTAGAITVGSLLKTSISFVLGGVGGASLGVIGICGYRKLKNLCLRC